MLRGEQPTMIHISNIGRKVCFISNIDNIMQDTIFYSDNSYLCSAKSNYSEIYIRQNPIVSTINRNFMND